jgi:hypothetical protein
MEEELDSVMSSIDDSEIMLILFICYRRDSDTSRAVHARYSILGLREPSFSQYI